MKWIAYERDDEVPNGSYAIGWMVDEGIFPDRAQWIDGVCSRGSFNIVMRSDKAFPTLEAAEDWAYHNDPEDFYGSL